MLHGLPWSPPSPGRSPRRSFAALAALALVLPLAGCGAAPAPQVASAPAPASAPSREASPPAPDLVDATAEAVEVPLPPWVARIDSPACSWVAERWSPRRTVELRTRPGGPVFARLSGGRARVHLPVGAAAHGLADVGSVGLSISGYVAREQVQLYPTVAFAMNGVVYPGGSSVLTWGEGFEDGASVTMDAPEGILVHRPPLTARRPCTDLSLDRGAGLSPAKAAFGKEYGENRIVRAGKTLNVFSDPSRPADVQLVLREDIYAMVFATSGAFSRIGAEMNGVYVGGWVRSNNLGEEWGGGLGSLGGFGRSGISTRRVPPRRTVVCGAEVPLVAEIGEERVTAGHVLAGTRIDVLSETGTFLAIQVEDAAIHPGISTTFLARASDLHACPSVPR